MAAAFNIVGSSRSSRSEICLKRDARFFIRRWCYVRQRLRLGRSTRGVKCLVIILEFTQENYANLPLPILWELSEFKRVCNYAKRLKSYPLPAKGGFDFRFAHLPPSRKAQYKQVCPLLLLRASVPPILRGEHHAGCILRCFLTVFSNEYSNDFLTRESIYSLPLRQGEYRVAGRGYESFYEATAILLPISFAFLFLCLKQIRQKYVCGKTSFALLFLCLKQIRQKYTCGKTSFALLFLCLKQIRQKYVCGKISFALLFLCLKQIRQKYVCG